MKVVINKCYGGFSFSDEFQYHLLLNVPELFQKMKPETYFGSKKRFKDVLNNTGDGLSKILNDFGDFLGLGSSFGINVFYEKSTDTIYNLDVSSSEPDFRSNPKLIAALENFGLHLAAGRFAELSIVDIPDGVEFEIQEYDGTEWIAETHRTWG